jgi:hypothetical protein
MDAIDIALRDAWFSLLERLEHDPEEVERRAGRAARALQRPVSAWCLRIRASDRRLEEWGLADPDAAAAGKAHAVDLTQWDIADLTAPVRLNNPWPGTDSRETARALGIGPTTMWKWMKAGVFEVERFDSRVIRKRIGPPVAMVASRRALDPTSRRARAPHLMWGCGWQRLAQDLPRAYETTLWRVAKAGTLAREWCFRCPGRYWPVPEGVGVVGSRGGGRTDLGAGQWDGGGDQWVAVRAGAVRASCAGGVSAAAVSDDCGLVWVSGVASGDQAGVG